LIQILDQNNAIKISVMSKLKENFVDVYKERCFIGISWSMLLQTILVLGLIFVIFKDTLNKK
jgi:RNA-binding protein YhbY